MSDDAGHDAATPAEARLLDHVAELRTLASGRELVDAVIGTARWQRAVRPYLSATGGLAAAVVAGARLLLARSAGAR